MEDAKEMKTPLHPTTCLGLDKESKQVGNTQYRVMIIPLLKLSASKPNIILTVGLCARFQQGPREFHLVVVKRILDTKLELLILFFTLSVERNSSDYVGDKIEKRRTSGSCHFIDGNLVTWISKKQGLIALSNTEAYYVLATSCCT